MEDEVFILSFTASIAYFPLLRNLFVVRSISFSLLVGIKFNSAPNRLSLAKRPVDVKFPLKEKKRNFALSCPTVSTTTLVRHSYFIENLTFSRGIIDFAA